MANSCLGFGLLGFPTSFSTGLCENRRAAAQQLYETIDPLVHYHFPMSLAETCDIQADIASPQAQAEVSQNPGTLVKPTKIAGIH